MAAGRPDVARDGRRAMDTAGRGDGGVRLLLVGKVAPGPVVVALRHPQGGSPDRRHRALWAGASSDLFRGDVLGPDDGADEGRPGVAGGGCPRIRWVWPDSPDREGGLGV